VVISPACKFTPVVVEYQKPIEVEAFSWAYAHFILEDWMSVLQPESPSKPRSLTRQVLRYASAMV
jgi:hypothetical protein